MRRRDGLSMVFLVLVILGIAGVLGAAYSSTTSALAREEHRSAAGEVAQVLAENMIDEAYYALFNRINAPRESARYKVDVYRALRDARAGESIRYEFPPVLAWRTATMPGAKLAPVEVELRILSFTTESQTTLVPTSISQALQPAASPAPATPAGTQRRACIGVTFVPVVTQRRFAVGEATFKAKVTMDAGSGIVVERQLEVGHELRVGRVSEQPPLAWVDMVPIRQWQLIDREVGK